MKKIFLFLFCIGYYELTAQPDTNWVQLNNYNPDFNFKLPNNPLILDTINIESFFFKVDSTLGLQVHFIDSISFDSSSLIFTTALTQTNYDTLRTIGKILLLISNGTLTSISDILIDNHRGLEIGFSYDELSTLEREYSFNRIFLYDDKFLTFSITGIETDLQRLLIYKEIFFNSINFD
ncbi:MAG TPA: hypothetical protein PLN13_09235 [Bacteroidia bacterium]|nr:hypothetical protein [Bacteroidia bacterium]HRH08751.1 hypothetical protein [Bacteroidia bacterium]